LSDGWVDVCAIAEVGPDTGVGALVEGRSLAVFRLADGSVHALSGFDPFSKTFVLARGIVGDRAGVPKVASPIFKQSFDLRTGQCLDDPTVRVPVHGARVRGGRIEVRLDPERRGL
jgi:nitrite reductase (NADH) small subunit